MALVCGNAQEPDGCLNPCDDVHLCVNVARASRPTPDNLQIEDEFYYTITVQNCSSSTLSNVRLYLRLGALICDNTAPQTPSSNAIGNIANLERDTNFCDAAVDANAMWNGNPDDIYASLNRLNAQSFDIPPGSFQAWVRFTSFKLEQQARLPSTVAVRADVRDSVCKYPCSIDKCVEVDGDCIKSNL